MMTSLKLNQREAGRTVADEIARLIQALGVQRIYGCPGATELNLMATARRYGLEYYFVVHECMAVVLSALALTCAGYML